MNPANSWWGQDSRHLIVRYSLTAKWLTRTSPLRQAVKLGSDQQHVSSASSSPMYISKTPQMKPIPWPQNQSVQSLSHERALRKCNYYHFILSVCPGMGYTSTVTRGLCIGFKHVHCGLVVAFSSGPCNTQPLHWKWNRHGARSKVVVVQGLVCP